MNPQTIRRAAVACGVAALAISAFVQLRPHRVEEPAAEPADVKPEWTAAVNTDATSVFQRAFWRRPGANDHILHAERIEWSDPQTGVAKWQWFIALKPGAEFKTWLREKNPFTLAPAASFQAPADTRRPAWFPATGSADDHEILRGDTMSILLTHDGGRMYATASGHGFAPALVSK